MLPEKPFSSSLSISHRPPTLVSIPPVLIHEAEFAARQAVASAMPEQELPQGWARVGVVLKGRVPRHRGDT